MAAIAVVALGTWAFRMGSAPPGLDSLIEANGDMVLLFCSGRATDGEFGQLYRMRIDGSEKHRISERHACVDLVAPDGRTILVATVHNSTEGRPGRLIRLRPQPGNEIAEWVEDPIPGAEHLLDPEISLNVPATTSEGWLVFSAGDSTGNRDLYAYQPETEEVRRLTSEPDIDRLPTADPRGEWVVFTSYRTGGGDLYRIRSDGTGLERLTDDPLQDDLAWLRGDSVVFVRGKGTEEEDGNMDVFLLDLVTGEETRLTDNDWNDYHPTWSPDGRYLCWQQERLGHYESDIDVMDLATGRTWTVVDQPGRDTGCAWTARGNGLLFQSYRTGDADVYLQPLQGGEPLNLTRYPEKDDLVRIFIPPAE